MKKLFLSLAILLWCGTLGASTGSGCYVSVNIDTNLDGIFYGPEDIFQGFKFTLNEADQVRQEATRKRDQEQGRKGVHIAWAPIRKTCTTGTNETEDSPDLHFIGCFNPESSSYKPITIVMGATLRVYPAHELGPSFARPYLYIESKTENNNGKVQIHRFMDLGRYTSFRLGKLDGVEGDTGEFIIQRSTLKQVQLSEDLTADVHYAIICGVDTSRTDIFNTGLH